MLRQRLVDSVLISSLYFGLIQSISSVPYASLAAEVTLAACCQCVFHGVREPGTKAPAYQQDQCGRLKVENHDCDCKYTAQQPTRTLIKPVVPDCPRVARGINNIAGKVLVSD